MAKLISDRMIPIINNPEKCYLLIDYITRPDLRETKIHMEIKLVNGKEEAIIEKM